MNATFSVREGPGFSSSLMPFYCNCTFEVLKKQTCIKKGLQLINLRDSRNNQSER